MSTAEPESDALDDLSKRLRTSCRRSLASLDSLLDMVDTRRQALQDSGGEGFDESLARAGAALSRSVKDICGELRQLEKHDKRMVLTPEQRFTELKKYLRTLDPMQRKEILALMQGIEKGRTA